MAAPTERLYARLDGDPLYAPETSVPAGTLRGFAVARALESSVAHIVLHEERLAEREMRGHVRALSVKLKPGAALALFGTSAHELAHRAVPWDEVVPPRARSLPERLLEARTDTARVHADASEK